MVMNSPARSLPLQLSAEDSPRFWKSNVDRSQPGHILQRKKVFFFLREASKIGRNLMLKKKKKKGKTIIILWPRRKIISSLDKSFVELENFQARHEVFFSTIWPFGQLLMVRILIYFVFFRVYKVYLLVFAIMKLAILFDWNLNFRLLLNLKLLWRIFW